MEIFVGDFWTIGVEEDFGVLVRVLLGENVYDPQNQLLRNRLLKRPKFLQHISFSPRKCDSGNTGHRFARTKENVV